MSMTDAVAEPMGIERLQEALEANDWDGGDDIDGEKIDLEDLDENDDEADGSVGFGIDPAEMEAEMAGMKQDIYGGGDGIEDENIDEENGDKEVEQLQAMMLKVQAVRGKSVAPTCGLS
jgi:hypothetical protein